VIPLKDDIPVDRWPVLTVGIIAVNILAFLWQVAVGLNYSVCAGGVIPADLLAIQDLGRAAGPLPCASVAPIVPWPLTVITSMFLHGGWGHIAFNMLFLWVFGNNVEDALGPVRFIAFYLACGVAAALSQSFLSAATGGVGIPMVGASGAIAGVLAAYMKLFPRARILTLVPIVIIFRLMYIPASFFIGLWFALQLFYAVAVGGAGSGVAFVAHVGGFVCGFLLVRVFAARRTSYGGRAS
jgi:membrane associated rhomboid family serine protease